MKNQWKTMAATVLTLFLCMADSVSAAETGTITAPSERIYKNMDTESTAIGNVIEGSSVLILEKQSDAGGGNWYLVEIMGIRGYIPARSVSVAEQEMHSQNEETTEESAAWAEEGVLSEADMSSEAETASEEEAGLPEQMRTTETVNVRSGATTESDIVGRIPGNTMLTYSGIQENGMGETWYEITYGDTHGYIRESTVETAEESVVEAEGSQQESEEAEQAQTVQSTATDITEQNEAFSESGLNGTGAAAQNGADAGQSEPVEEVAGQEKEETVPVEETEPETEQQGMESEPETEQQTETEKERNRFVIDRVVVISMIGSLVCVAALIWLVRKMIGLYKK